MAETLNMNKQIDNPIEFDWHYQTTTIADEPFELAVASDPDGMLIDACQRQDDGELGVIDPFWAATWRAAAGMDRYLCDIDLKQTRVLELGCGTGHAGIAAARRGADVTLTDGVEDPLCLVRLSIKALPTPPRVSRLRFGKDKIDGQRFDLILGSDVTYLRQLWPDLEQCVQTHLADDGVWLLSDPFRIIANEFRQWIQSTDRWHYDETSMAMDDDPEHPIRVMRLTRS